MELVIDIIDNVHVARVAHRLDQSTSDEFRAALEHVAQRCPGRIVLDLEGVGFICSACLGAMVSFKQKLTPEQSLVLTGLSVPIHKMFKVAAFDRIFQIADTPEQAMAMFE